MKENTKIKTTDLQLLEMEYNFDGKAKRARFYMANFKFFDLKIKKTERVNIPDRAGWYVNIYLEPIKE